MPVNVCVFSCVYTVMHLRQVCFLLCDCCCTRCEVCNVYIFVAMFMYAAVYVALYCLGPSVALLLFVGHFYLVIVCDLTPVRLH